ncbi:hypothetical protein J4E86_008216 [Alternaria arbusti]|uniref:uncharacterized protein n=1 Tax=Alternaria arbusti TaxID=232088 RepID=UPI002220833E|nr:uncharacterized protein J4E86_008216 [Alternaria arbusti]KAI4948867.1 hypothetical protein J4E86_008216 [Alternaria arbusti]
MNLRYQKMYSRQQGENATPVLKASQKTENAKHYPKTYDEAVQDEEDREENDAEELEEEENDAEELGEEDNDAEELEEEAEPQLQELVEEDRVREASEENAKRYPKTYVN